MKTKIIKLTKNSFRQAINRAATQILRGQIVVFPTETVYGLGANALSPLAVKKIFKAKGRPIKNPVIVHVASRKQLEQLVYPPTNLEKRLMQKFWPGPLTLILRKKPRVSKIVTGNLSTVAVRMPKHKFALELIKKSGVPVAAPSANVSERPSGTHTQHIYEDLKDKVPLIVDAGTSSIGVESTVVKIEKNKIFILRPGAITKEMLERAAHTPAILPKNKYLKSSPGTQYRHYAPEAKIEIFKNEAKLQKRKKTLRNKKIKILKYKSLKEMSHRLYRDLRQADLEKAEKIFVVAVPRRGLGLAIMDRLQRASMR